MSASFGVFHDLESPGSESPIKWHIIFMWHHVDFRFHLDRMSVFQFQMPVSVIVIEVSCSEDGFNLVSKYCPAARVKDVRGWQFLTMKAAETLCTDCLPPEKHIS